ncbi:uncharacterized protein TRIREDRAFT_106879 [Trichoderma reesei QM6a]|uniref:Predicted protein n=2 Tax=Hypocrea jecorina TaxID=51453 RepID=G0RI99_HYPJQ|nr:uncharacterized protein TRIREDRAFT_106879 [Trichoderma reesei QM6a]EGR48922.1 predicted protein [Trichoderma reesei QM6a]ETS02558.1 hypothetical protein M419DRAFT_8189 [Trichoderma reesei RUT C-30]
MQFKLLSVFAAALTVQSAYGMSSSQQGKAIQQSEQSQQVHQLEQLAQDIQTQQAAEIHQLDIGGAGLNATAVTATLNSVSDALAVAGNSVSNITSTTLAQQFPNIVNTLSTLAGSLVTNAGNLVTTPVTSTFNQTDQLNIYNTFINLTKANDQFIKTFLGPTGIVSNSLLRGPIGIVLNLIERTIVNLAGATIARIPAYADQAQAQLSNIHADLALTIRT